MNLIKIPPYDQIHWGVLISTTVWCLGGYDFAGSVAGEIKGGKKAFIIGILATFPLKFDKLFISNSIFITYIIDSDDRNWVAGFF